MGNYQNTTDPRIGEPESPTIGISAHGLKGCLILLKNKSCQNCVLTIPLCRGGRDEATVENRVEIGHRKHPNRRGYCPRAQMRATRHTRLLRPDGLTRIPYDPTHVPDRIRMTSSLCKHDVIMHNQHARAATSQQSGTHLPRHQPRAELRRAELSRAVLEQSRAASRGKRFCAAESTCNRI